MRTDARWGYITVGLLLCLSILTVWNQTASGATKGEEYYRTGTKYLLGEGMPQDNTEAAKWLHKAAEQGHTLAQSDLGTMYQLGAGVPQDDAEAVRWYRKAAAQGEPHAQHNLGRMHENGRGVPEDDAEAVRWYRKAAEQGHADAQDELRKRGLSWSTQSPEQDVSQSEIRTPSTPPPAQRSRPAPPSRPAAKKQAPTPTRTPKIPDDLGDLD